MFVMHDYAVNRKLKCLQYQLVRMIAVPFARTKISHTILSMSIGIGTFHWTIGHRRNFATKSGGDKILNRLTQGRFRRGLMDRGGESCKGVVVAEVTRPNISWE